MPGAVAITGIAALTAFGDLRRTFEAGLGKDARKPVSPRLPEEGGDREDDPTERILGFAGRALEGCCRVAHETARASEIPREEVGLYAATGMVDSAVEELAPAARASRTPEGRLDLAQFFLSGFRSIHPLWPLSMLNNVAVGQIATELDIRGDNLVLASEADAGARAVEEAVTAVRSGAVRAALVGGVSERISPASAVRRSLRHTEGEPGEAAAAIVLEHPDSARSRGVPVLGHVLGTACAHGEDAEERAIAAAVLDAGLAEPPQRLVSEPFPLQGWLGPASVPFGIALGGYLYGRTLHDVADDVVGMVVAHGPSGGVGAVVLSYPRRTS